MAILTASVEQVQSEATAWCKHEPEAWAAETHATVVAVLSSIARPKLGYDKDKCRNAY